MATDPASVTFLPDLAARLVPTPDPADLTRVHEADVHLQAARRALHAVVMQARGAGRSWADIGATVGITREGARRRWTLVVETDETVEAS